MQYSTELLRYLRSTIGQNIHRERCTQKMPLSKLAKLTGISELLIDHYELGKNEIRLDHLLRITCALDIQFTSLFDSF